MRYLSFILRFIESKINKHRKGLKIYWWRPRVSQGRNFGDEITPFLVKELWGLTCRWTSIGDADLVGAGSVIDLVNARNPKNHVVKIWGSGILEDGPKLNTDSMDICLVRGPLTLSRMDRENTIPLGDPGLLISKIVRPQKGKRRSIGIVPHMKDLKSHEVSQLKQSCYIISPLQSPEKVAEDIASCDIIFSSSLHGLIFADSFKIPNYRFTLHKLEGGDYKFEDYAASINRSIDIISVNELKEIIRSTSKRKQLIHDYKPIKNLEAIQDRIINSFPYK